MNITNVSQKRICLFGGTFDPIHFGHISMANKAIEVFNFNEIVFLPTGNSYLKTNVTEASKRCDMVEIATRSNEKFTISYIEAKSDVPSYTYITLQKYKKMYPDTELYYLIGEDSLRYIEFWKESQTIFDLCHIIVARRNNDSTKDNRDYNDVVSGLLERYGARISSFDFDMPISSTAIRNAFKSDNTKEIEPYIDSEVYKYIKDNNLYKE